MSDFDYFAENDPEAFDESDRELETELRAEAREGLEYTDPFADWFMPGYPTEMDYLNAQEADDYRDEFDDIEF